MEFAPARLIELLECSRNYAYDLLSGKRTPRLEHAVAIIEWSSGLTWTQKARSSSASGLTAQNFLPSDPESDPWPGKARGFKRPDPD